MSDESKSGVTPPVAVKRKAPSTAWKPGQSGNPGGFPKELVEVQALARAHTKDMVEGLVSIANDLTAPPAARVAAQNSVLDRAWGKPTQPIVSDGPVLGITFVVEG
jgi:hypothetical protein